MGFFEANREIVEQRWPSLLAEVVRVESPVDLAWTPDAPDPTLVVSGIHLTSSYNRGSEAVRQARLIPDDSISAWIYGFALGDLPRALLERESLRELHVVVMNPAIMKASLEHFDHTDWLGDQRVELHSALNATGVRRPFAAAPACLKLASDGAANLRDAVALELARPFQKSHFQGLEDELESVLTDNTALVKKDGDVASLFGAAEGRHAVVVSGGPTAPDQFPWIGKDRPNHVLLAVSTALIPLQRAGILPDAVVVIDPKPVMREHFLGADLAALAEIPLIYLPTVQRSVLELWPGPRLAAYIRRSRFEKLDAEIPRGFLHCSGTVTHTAVDLAVKMGAAEVVLVGADFCYPGGASHMEGAAQREDVKNIDGHARPWVINGRGQRVPSRMDMVGFLRDLELYIARHKKVTFINAGRDGAEIAGARWREEDTL